MRFKFLLPLFLCSLAPLLLFSQNGGIVYERAQGGLSATSLLAVGHPAESKGNTTASLQDYSSIYTIPANYLTDNKLIRVTLGFELVTGTSTVTYIHSCKLGSTTVFASGPSADQTNGVTRSCQIIFIIQGTAAASGSAPVETFAALSGGYASGGMLGTTDQPVNLATNGTLTIVPGITYSGTGSTETMVLRSYMVEALN